MNLTPVVISLGVGAADGYLARQDAVDPSRQGDTMKMHSAWLEAAGLAAGFLLNSRARTNAQSATAEALMYSSGALLARRGGVRVAVGQEHPAGVPGGGALAAAHVFRPMVAAGQFSRGGQETNLMRSMGSFI